MTNSIAQNKYKTYRHWDSAYPCQGTSYQCRDPEACIRQGAQWCHLANTTEPSMCGSDAACCQITLTTCLHNNRRCDRPGVEHLSNRW